jgi:phosphatidylinositol-3-phosphatase
MQAPSSQDMPVRPSYLYLALSSVILSALALITACSGARGMSGPSSKPAQGAVPQFGHVVLVVEENHSYSSVIGNSAMPYLNSLARRYGLATNYYANVHQSIGNYFVLTTGQIITVDDSFNGTVDADNLARELLAAGKTWKSYAESLPSVGYTGGDVFPYLEHHNPFSYFSDVRSSSAQLQNLVPFTQFAADLSANSLPNFAFVVPNAENDAHSCPDGSLNCDDSVRLSVADNWLQSNIAPLLASSAFQKDGLLVIVFDESFDIDLANGGGHVPMLVISSRAKSGEQSTTFFQHQSTLRMLIEATGAKEFPGASGDAPDMGEFFQ